MLEALYTEFDKFFYVEFQDLGFELLFQLNYIFYGTNYTLYYGCSYDYMLRDLLKSSLVYDGRHI